MKEVIYKLFVAYDCGITEHPQEQMEKLGYKVIKAEPQTLGECWFFWVEDYIEPMPGYLIKVKEEQ